MYDFCLTVPYGFILFIWGAINFIYTHDLAALTCGGGLGLTLIGLGKVSWNNYDSVNTKIAEDMHPIDFPTVTSMAISLLISMLISVVMGVRFHETQEFKPAGMVMSMSIFMSFFYVYKMVTQKEHKRKTVSKSA